MLSTYMWWELTRNDHYIQQQVWHRPWMAPGWIVCPDLSNSSQISIRFQSILSSGIMILLEGTCMDEMFNKHTRHWYMYSCSIIQTKWVTTSPPPLRLSPTIVNVFPLTIFDWNFPCIFVKPAPWINHFILDRLSPIITLHYYFNSTLLLFSTWELSIVSR